MGPRLFFICLLCLLAWLACASFVGLAIYMHYVMGVKNIAILIYGAIASGCGGTYLVHEIIYGNFSGR